MNIDKPVIFVSHAATDRPIAEILKSEIDRVFANGIDVFASSIPGSVRPGIDWLSEIRANLEKATAVIVLITPVSINRPWIWFEIGAYWSIMQAGSGKIYPLCVPEVDLLEIPDPLNRLQALSLGKADQVKLFFQHLCDQFRFGNMKGFRGSAISKKLPKYSDIKIDINDLKSGTIYSGPYEGYSNDELKEILDDHIYQQRQSYYDVLRFSVIDEPNRISNIFAGKLIHYRKLDEILKLPTGTSKRLLKEVALRYGLIPDNEWENSIRFIKQGE